MQDVALLAVRVFDQRDAGRAVRIVFDLLHGRDHAEAVAMEVDLPVHALVATATAPDGDVSVIVTATGLLDRLQQGLFRCRPRDLGEIRNRTEARALGDRLELSYAHGRLSPRIRSLRSCRLHAASRLPSSRPGACPVSPGRRGATFRAPAWSRRP